MLVIGERITGVGVGFFATFHILFTQRSNKNYTFLNTFSFFVVFLAE